ncbi:hypothetical protein NQ315_008452 [Exocentrus adspersus]|uniref:Uncharacterized protein n=1 Tax=Exocentrus adspersus TaxID=1586481 RepID=A0AAV8W5D7_9CUCU|nr:hypothetical protein NQ315_008452 [Exocentrus adspersus]
MNEPVKKDIGCNLGCNGLRGSEITLYGEMPQIQVEKADKMQPRTKVKTNGHFTTYMQVVYRIKNKCFVYQVELVQTK